MGFVFAAAAVGTSFWAWTVPPAQRIDFDITGFLWLISNIPFLLVWGVVLVFAGIAVSCWVRANRL
jgi:hypothetical protein